MTEKVILYSKVDKDNVSYLFIKLNRALTKFSTVKVTVEEVPKVEEQFLRYKNV